MLTSESHNCRDFEDLPLMAVYCIVVYITDGILAWLQIPSF